MSGLSRVIDLGVFVLALAVPVYFVLRVRRFGYLLGVLAMWGILIVGGTTFRWSAEETRVLLFRYNWLYTGWIVGAVWCAIVCGLKRFVLWLKRGKSRVGVKVGASVCLAAGTAIVILAVPGTLRCWAYYNLTKDPKMLAALKIKPERIELPDTSADPYFSLGYAEVRLGPERITEIKRHSTAVSVDCDGWSVLFCWPYSPAEERNEELEAHPVAGPLMREMVEDTFSWRLKTLNVEPKRFGEVFFMGGREFLGYWLLLIAKMTKVGLDAGAKRVEVFETADIGGFVYLNEGSKIQAEVYSKGMNIGQIVRIACDSRERGSEELYKLLASYRFVLKELPDEEGLKQLIQTAVGGHEKFVESEE
jgi:hypothetical protein